MLHRLKPRNFEKKTLLYFDSIHKLKKVDWKIKIVIWVSHANYIYIIMTNKNKNLLSYWGTSNLFIRFPEEVSKQKSLPSLEHPNTELSAGWNKSCCKVSSLWKLKWVVNSITLLSHHRQKLALQLQSFRLVMKESLTKLNRHTIRPWSLKVIRNTNLNDYGFWHHFNNNFFQVLEIARIMVNQNIQK